MVNKNLIFDKLRNLAKYKKDLELKQVELDNELKDLIYNLIISNLNDYNDLTLYNLNVWYKNLTTYQIGISLKNQEMIEWENLLNLKKIMKSKLNCELNYISNNNEKDLNYYFDEIKQ